MAKIVPQGYANIQQSNETNDYLLLMQYLDSLAGQYKDIKQNQITRVNSGLQELLNHINEGFIDSDEDMQMMKNHYNSLKKEAYGTNDAVTENAFDRFGNIIEKEEDDFKMYKQGVDEFMTWYDIDRFSQLYTPDGQLDIEKLQQWDEGQIAGFNEITNKYMSMKSKLGYNPATQQFINPKYANYSVTDKNNNTVKGSDLQAKMMEMDNLITKIGYGLTNVISPEEVNLIANNVIDARQFQQIMQQGINEANQGISAAQGRRDKYTILLNNLEQDKFSEVGVVLNSMMSGEDPDGEFMQYIQGYGNENFGAQGWVEFLKTKPGDIEARAANLIAKKNEGVSLTSSEALLVSKYEQYEEFIKDIRRNVTFETSQIENSINKYNAFSPIPYDVNMSGSTIKNVPTQGSKTVTVSDVDRNTAESIFYSLPQNSRDNWLKVASDWDGESVLFGGGISSPIFPEQSNETVDFNGKSYKMQDVHNILFSDKENYPELIQNTPTTLESYNNLSMDKRLVVDKWWNDLEASDKANLFLSNQLNTSSSVEDIFNALDENSRGAIFGGARDDELASSDYDVIVSSFSNIQATNTDWANKTSQDWFNSLTKDAQESLLDRPLTTKLLLDGEEFSYDAAQWPSISGNILTDQIMSHLTGQDKALTGLSGEAALTRGFRTEGTEYDNVLGGYWIEKFNKKHKTDYKSYFDYLLHGIGKEKTGFTKEDAMERIKMRAEWVYGDELNDGILANALNEGAMLFELLQNYHSQKDPELKAKAANYLNEYLKKNDYAASELLHPIVNHRSYGSNLMNVESNRGQHLWQAMDYDIKQGNTYKYKKGDVTDLNAFINDKSLDISETTSNQKRGRFFKKFNQLFKGKKTIEQYRKMADKLEGSSRAKYIQLLAFYEDAVGDNALEPGEFKEYILSQYNSNPKDSELKQLVKDLGIEYTYGPKGRKIK